MAQGMTAKLIGAPRELSTALFAFDSLGAADVFTGSLVGPLVVLPLQIFVQLPLFGEIDKVGVTARDIDGFDISDLSRFCSDVRRCGAGVGHAELLGDENCLRLRIDSHNDGSARVAGHLNAPVPDDVDWDDFSRSELERGAMGGPFRLDFAFATYATALREFAEQLEELRFTFGR